MSLYLHIVFFWIPEVLDIFFTLCHGRKKVGKKISAGLPSRERKNGRNRKNGRKMNASLNIIRNFRTPTFSYQLTVSKLRIRESKEFSTIAQRFTTKKNLFQRSHSKLAYLKSYRNKQLFKGKDVRSGMQSSRFSKTIATQKISSDQDGHGFDKNPRLYWKNDWCGMN